MAGDELKAAARALEQAAPAKVAPRFDAAPAEKPAGGGRRGRPYAAPGGLLPGCPVTPLGTHDGLYFYLDTVGQLRSLKARDHGNKDLLSLFAPRTDFVHTTWPRVNEKGLVTGWRPEQAAEELMCACSVAGVWNAFDRVRGRGAWADDDGGLILHAGDAVLMDGEWQRTGLIGDYVYPSAPPLGRPLEQPASAAMMDDLLGVVKSWNWMRPGLDPYLLLGWLGAAKVAGALEWRPLAWVTGDKGTGKSTLQRLIKGLMGQGLLSTTDATEAGIRQTLGNQTLPVAVDEAEADEDNRKMQALIKLARQAASGGDITRGGSDHTASRFQARSCFLLSSILIPALKSQDRSRLAILDLQPLPRGGAEPKLRGEWMAGMGGAMTRRMLDGWPRFDETLQIYREMLKSAGHGARGADQFGTLLACADLLLADSVPAAADVAEWAGLLAAATLAETGDDKGEADRCLEHLLTSTVTLDGGSRPQTVAQWLDRAAREIDDQEAGITMPGDVQIAERHLAIIGLRVFRARADGAKLLAVSVAHQGLARLFAGSHWQAASGANGVWGQALARLPAAHTTNVRVGGLQGRRVVLPLALALAEGEDEGGL